MDRAPALASRWVSVWTVLLVIAACGTTRTYEGPRRSRDEVAVIAPSAFADRPARILRVDHESLGTLDREVEVLPGRHVVTLCIPVNDSSIAQGDVEFDAKGGRTYAAHAASTGWNLEQHWFWIIDSTDESIVGGRPPEGE